MINKLNIMLMELKYVLRQKFLWLMILVGVAIIAYRMPRFSYEFNYDVFLDSYNEEKTDAEKAIIDYWSIKRGEVEEERKSLVQKAEKYEKELKEDQLYEKEYFAKIQQYYSEELDLELQDYLGWEIFFFHQTNMAPHNPVSLLSVIIISSAGLLLLAKDKENKTLFWAATTGKGAMVSSFILKIIVIFIYGIILQLFFTIIYVGWLWLGVGLDMRHWFNLIQNIPQFGICDLQLNILEVIVIDIVLKSALSIVMFLLVFLLSVILKRYLFLFLADIAACTISYYSFYVINEIKNYDFWWRIHPFSILKLDKMLTYDAVNILNHAVDVRIIVSLGWISLLIVLSACSYQIWRRYLYESSSKRNFSVRNKKIFY